jgi:hypothetical protein
MKHMETGGGLMLRRKNRKEGLRATRMGIKEDKMYLMKDKIKDTSLMVRNTTDRAGSEMLWSRVRVTP